MTPMSGSSDDFLRPLYRRVALLLICAIWAGMELYFESGIWVTIAIAATVYATWDFFLRGKYRDPPEESGAPPADD